MAEAGRMRVQELWTWEKVAERTERAYVAARAAMLKPGATAPGPPGAR